MGIAFEEAWSQWAQLTWRTWSVPCLLTLTAFIYGSWTVVAKVALANHGVLPLVLAFYRAFGGSSIMFIMLGLTKACNPQSHSVTVISRDDVFRFVGLGLLLALNMGGNILAVEALSSITVAVFQPLLPVIAGLAAVLLGIEELSSLKVLGIFCAVSGAVLVVVLSPSNHGHQIGSSVNLARGIPCLLINVTAGALYAVCQKSVLRRHPPIFTAATAFVSASFFLLVAAVCTAGRNANAWRLADSDKARFALIYAIFLVTALNYSILAWANKFSSPTTVTSFMTLQPICAAVLACIFLHEVLTWGQLGGGAVIIAGLASFVSAMRNEHTPAEVQTLIPIKHQPANDKLNENM